MKTVKRRDGSGLGYKVWKGFHDDWFAQIIDERTGAWTNRVVCAGMKSERQAIEWARSWIRSHLKLRGFTKLAKTE